MKPAAVPILKWAGGKAWLVPKLGPYVQQALTETGGRYIEPFLGGGAMALALAPEKAILSDVVGPLIEFYKVLRENPGELAWELSALGILGVDKDNFLRVREMRPERPVQRAARFLFLNRLCFNGLYRENSKGEFNVPYGQVVHRKSIIGRSARDAMDSLFPNKEKMHKVADALKGAELYAGDFESGVVTADRGDVVFADPPYDDTFNGYSKTGFSLRDQERLSEELYLAHYRGARVYACNADTENVRRWYNWATILPVKEQRRIAASKDSRGRASCVLITNHPGLETLDG